MRIGYIVHQFYPEFSGGTERVTFNLAKCGQRAGHYVRVIACKVTAGPPEGHRFWPPNGLVETIYKSIPVTLVRRESLPPTGEFSLEVDSGFVRVLAPLLARERFDVFHVMHAMRMATAVAAVRNAEIPYLVTLTDFFFECFTVNRRTVENKACRGAEGGEKCVVDCLVAPWSPQGLRGRYLQGREILQGASRRVCPSRFVAESFRQEFDGLKFDVIPHGIDLTGLSDTGPERREGGSGVVFGFVGTIVPQKGLDVLIKAFREVVEPTARLRICGGFFGNLAYEKHIRSLIGGDARIELRRPVSPAEALKIIRSVDILCLPSVVPETFSLVLHESFAARVPAMVSNIGAQGQVVSEEGAGLVVEAGSVPAWKAALEGVLADPARVGSWQARLPLPLRIEEEAALYEQLYREAALPDDY
jgi:glycosyltransferase involved in cell wall biosynthesis